MEDYVNSLLGLYAMTPCREIMFKGSGGHHELPPQNFRALIIHTPSPILVTVVEVGYPWGRDNNHRVTASATACADEAEVWISAARLRDEWYAAIPEAQRREENADGNDADVPF